MLCLCIIIWSWSYSAAIISSPTSKLVSINEQDGVTFHCTVKGESLEWVINDEYPSISRNDRLIENGVEFTNCPRINGVINCSITFPSTLYFNMTRLRCGTQNLTTVRTSEEVIMIIAGTLYIITNSSVNDIICVL